MNKYIFIILLYLISGVCIGQPQKETLSTKFPIVAWYSVDAAHNTRAQYKQMAKAGFNLSLSDFLTREETNKGLQEARGTGVKLIVDCQESRDANPTFIVEMKDNPSLGMYYICDEPDKDSFDNLVAKVNRINVMDGVHAGYINLLPIYANNEQLKAESYDEYLDTYLSKVHTPFLSYDHYPFVHDTFRDDFYTNLEVVSKKCKEAGIPFWGFAQTLYSKDYYLIDEGRLRLQVFTNMAYGAQGIQYFTYGVPSDGSSAIVDTLYHKTELYDVVKKINREVEVVGKYSLNADFTIVTHVSGKYKSVAIAHIDKLDFSGETILVSLFEKQGVKYVLMLNKDYINKNKISVEFKSKTRLINKKGRKKAPRKQYDGTMEAGDWLLFQLY